MLKSLVRKWRLIRNKQKIFVDFKSLANEIKDTIGLNTLYLENFAVRYLKEKNPLNHPYVEIAQIYNNCGLHERASEFYLRYLAVHKDEKVYSCYLQNLLLSASSTNASLLKPHQTWNELFIDNSIQPLKHTPKPKAAGEKIKLGYVCHFFANSVSQNCLLPFLKAHNRDKFEIYCYDDGSPPDQAHYYGDHWYDIRGLSDKAVADLIHRDNIDILQELNGFCFLHRFGALAYRPAPIQINWYNYTGSTGLPFIDYVMSDVTSIVDEDLPYFVEQVYRSKKFIAAIEFQPEKYGNPIKQTPASIKGYITFCYFGATHKITLNAVELWSRILKKVPNSKLLLKAGNFSHKLYRDLFTKHFKAFGIDQSQLILDGWSDQIQTIQKYNDIDIMLDNIPFNGGTTMFEALLQGVPPVTKLGNRWAARSGPSVLKALGHPELIANADDEYVDIAVNLANDLPRLNAYRTSLRNDMLQSPLTNIQEFYQNFEKAYEWMWQRWCANS